jgi:hypothetical protein
MASIRKTASGKWQARISIKGQPKSIGTFATKKEAQEKAAFYEKEIKPEIIKDDLLELLEKDLLIWKSRLNDFESLERFTIQLHVDKLETTLKIYKREKQEHEADLFENI